MRISPSINTIMVPTRDSTHFSSRARNAPTPAKSTKPCRRHWQATPIYLMRKSSHSICLVCHPPFWKIINPLIPYLSLKDNEENKVDNNLQNHSIFWPKSHTKPHFSGAEINCSKQLDTQDDLLQFKTSDLFYPFLTISSTNKKTENILLFEKTYSFDSTSIL